MIIKLSQFIDKHSVRVAFSIAFIFHSLLVVLALGLPEHEGIGEDAVSVFEFSANPPANKPNASISRKKERPPNPDSFGEKKEAEEQPTTEVDPNDPNVIESEAYDLSFAGSTTGNGAKIPRLRTQLPKCYPPLAKQQGIEADTLSELIINKEGFVVKVNIIGVKLNKILPVDAKKQMVVLFNDCVKLAFKGAKFSPPYIDGKNIAIKMEQPLNFSLNN